MKRHLMALPLFAVLLFPPEEGLAAFTDGAAGRAADEQFEAAAVKPEKPEERMIRLKNSIISRFSFGSRREALEELKKYPLGATLPLWIEILRKSRSPEVKKTAIDHIAGSYDRRIVPPVVEELSNPYSVVRESAIKALKKTGDDRMYPHIINMARSGNPIYKIYALEAIYLLYDRRFNAMLLEFLRDESKSVRYYALKCIEKNRLTETLPIIRNIAAADQNGEVRIKAMEVIRDFGDRSAVYVLLKCLGDRDRDIRRAAALALHDFRVPSTAFPVSTQLAAEEHDDIKELLIETLIRIRSSGGLRGLDRVISQEKNDRLRIKAAFALGEVAELGAVPLLLRALGDRDYRVRAEACNSLGGYRGQRTAVTSLIGIIRDETNLYVRLSALYALQRINDRAMALPLFDQYGVENDPVFRDKLRLMVRRFIER